MMRKLSTVKYRTWRRAVRKYHKLHQRLSATPSVQLSQKMEQLRRRIVRLNRRWQVGIAAATLTAWLAMPTGAQAQETILSVGDLNGENGFTVLSEDERGFVGSSVSIAGDVNGDGLDDVIIGTSLSGQNYVVFGSSDGFPAELSPSQLNGRNGFILQQASRGNDNPQSVSGAGDVNGDGLADIIVEGSDQGYVVLGNERFAPRLDVSIINQRTVTIDTTIVGGVIVVDTTVTVNDSTGFLIEGTSLTKVNSAGDVNGDGIDDIIATGRPDSGDGGVYVLFGRTNLAGSTIDVAALDGSNGFLVTSNPRFNRFSSSVSEAGDVNGDGFDDVIIGSEFAFSEVTSPRGTTYTGYSGESYVIFGRGSGLPAELSVTELDGSNGFTIGTNQAERLGRSVSNAGDVNGDGLDDVVVGAPAANPIDQYGRLDQNAGKSYVIFGRETDFSARLDVDELDGDNGFSIEGYGGDALNYTGQSVSGAGDVNGDGLDDVIIGTPGAAVGDNANTAGLQYVGESYVIFGQSDFDAVVEVFGLGGDDGFIIGGSRNSPIGLAVGGGGDVNGDGLDDLIVGSSEAEPGRAHVVFGGIGTASQAPIIVTGLSLFDATSDQAVGTLTDGDVLNAASFGADGFDVSVLTQGSTVQRIEFTLVKPDGSVLQRTETSAPYVLFGHRGRDFNGMEAIPGDYTLTVSPFLTDSDGQPTPGEVVTVNFSIIGQTTTVELTLFDATIDQAIGTLEDGDVLNAADFGVDGFDVQVRTPGSRVSRVEFALRKPNGSVLRRTERIFPYVLFGDQGQDFNGMAAVPGDYTLTVSPFLVDNAGQVIPSRKITVRFSIVGQANLSVYPNTFTNELKVQTVQTTDLQVRLQSVTDGKSYVIGADLISQEADGLRVDTQGLPAGHYILQLTDPTQTHTLHVIKAE